MGWDQPIKGLAPLGLALFVIGFEWFGDRRSRASASDSEAARAPGSPRIHRRGLRQVRDLDHGGLG